MKTSENERTGSVVVGFDGGWRMKGPLSAAADEAVRRETDLAIVTICRPMSDPRQSIEGLIAQKKQAEEVDRQRLAAAVESVHAMHAHLPVTAYYLTEAQAEAACHPLASTQLLVVGAAGRYGRRAFGLETASRVLLRAAGCPVLVVPEEDPMATAEAARAVVVAGIGDHAADVAVIQAAWAEAFQRGCDLLLVHAYRDLPAETPDRGLRRAAEVTARSIADAHVPLGATTSVLLSQASPASVLAQHATVASLMVIGSRPGSLAGLVLGSTGHEILNSLACPMLVIPHPDTRSRPAASPRMEVRADPGANDKAGEAATATSTMT